MTLSVDLEVKPSSGMDCHLLESWLVLKERGDNFTQITKGHAPSDLWFPQEALQSSGLGSPGLY